MIIGEQKPLDEIKGLVGDAGKVLVVGCGTCVTVCFAGGEREADVLASLMRMSNRLDGGSREVADVTVQRQCEYEYNEAAEAHIQDADVIVQKANLASYYGGADGRSEVRMIITDAQERRQRRPRGLAEPDILNATEVPQAFWSPLRISASSTWSWISSARIWLFSYIFVSTR